MFRAPDYPALFAVFLGIGFQVYVLAFLFIGTMCLMLINYFFRPFLFAAAFLYSAGTAWINGFFTGKAMKSFGATDWCFAAMASAFAFPFYLFASLISIDFIEYLKKSSATVPPFTVIVMGFIWACIAIPLSFNGAHIAFKQKKVDVPCRVNPLKRKIPD